MATPEERPRILMLWSVPRARSTAVFRMMCERGDVTAVFEPFSCLANFGVSDIGEVSVHGEREALAALRGLGQRCTVFVKDTTENRYPGVLADEAFLARDARHAFLIRHPRETIASCHALNPGIGYDQIGFEALHELFTVVRQRSGETPVVIDAEDLMADPEGIIRAYCARMDITFRAGALAWRPETRKEWLPTREWHRDVSASSGFEVLTKKAYPDITASPVLHGYMRRSLPYYEELRSLRVQVNRSRTARWPDRLS
ncbi:sulfotransferase-like domain-containing protein [Streptomyces litchfieldiae]|uniref:Sulfotransferase family protein n=1 Tax=Streptomyces litchfieldiae TaxID=3075543 RepID=A0ABU2MQN6_9ACTN|nr:sulfotransferase family protein [Streptomyces sp. DSM 44938]MDT0343941.1 sulfotransferase family protein [Streptomyces sp. DSM 44938]